jgi:hypothetical protein
MVVGAVISCCNGNLYPILEGCPCGNCAYGCDCFCDDSRSLCGQPDQDADQGLDADIESIGDGDLDGDRETDGEE